jgi:membrane associated rhomboid family serine protease
MPDSWDFSQRPKRTETTSGPPYTTGLLCLISVLVTLATSFPDDSAGSVWSELGHAFYSSPTDIWSGKFYELMTPVFVHANLVAGGIGFTHLLFNMLWLWRLGALVEIAAGPLAFLGFCCAAAAVGCGAQLLFSGQTGIGMSGVVYALFGLMWASKGRYPTWDAIATRDNLRFFVLWGLFCIVATTFHLFDVANAAHVGGFLFGLAVGYAFVAPRKRPVWIAVVVLLAATTVMAATWIPWDPIWQAWHANPSIAMPSS